MKKNKKAWPWLFLSLFIIAADQITKYFVLHHIVPNQTIKIAPFLNFILSFNAGASFGFLNNQSGWQVYMLSAVSLIISAILIVWLCRLKRSEWWITLPISLVLGGALGNLIDRIRFGLVTDFIDFHVNHWHFATFNIADSAISVGTIWLILRLLYESVTRES